VPVEEHDAIGRLGLVGLDVGQRGLALAQGEMAGRCFI
jgi:hypothetical protein